MQRSAPRHPPLQRCIFTLRNLEKVQLWMHPPTSINDRAGPPDPPCWLIKCFLGLVVSLKALWGWFNLALRFVSIVASRKLIFFLLFFFFREKYLSCFSTKFSIERWRQFSFVQGLLLSQPLQLSPLLMPVAK